MPIRNIPKTEDRIEYNVEYYPCGNQVQDENGLSMQ